MTTRDNPLLQSYLKRILNSRVYDLAVETPLEEAKTLSKRIGNTVLLKREDTQPVFSFKLRGAYNKMAQLTEQARARGVLAASAGNHAQGVALSARTLGCTATIVMPVTTPQIKVDAVKAYGAKIVLFGDSYSDAAEYAKHLCEEQKLTFIHPYDDPEVIAGQGTIAMEILRQRASALDVVFVPIGGGGLAAGVAAYIKAVRPSIKVIGVEPVDSDAMKKSIAAKRRVTLPQVGLFADGVAVRQVGVETFRLCRENLDAIITVSTGEMCAAIKDGFEATRAIFEPAGALSIAAAKKYAEQTGCSGKTFAAIISGANMNFDRIRFVSEVTEIGEAREAILACTIPERPGSFKQFCELIGKRSVTEFNYRFSTAAHAHVFVGLQVKSAEETNTLIATLKKHGLGAIDLSHSALAKEHIRHLVGGHVTEMPDEVVYRFEFPERPGALLAFLNALSCGWNITLFHYRNHGADYGKVLVGIRVPRNERATFNAALKTLGYVHTEVSNDPAFRLFLGNRNEECHA